MAIIYGRADSEKQLLDMYPERIQKINDIDKVEAEMKDELKAESKGLVARRWSKKRLIYKNTM